MSYFTHHGKLYEIVESSPVDEAGFHYECWDLTLGTGGDLGRIIVPEADESDGEEIQIRLTRPVPVQVLLRWMHFVPELERYGISPG
jgi:hypothetical protein